MIIINNNRRGGQRSEADTPQDMGPAPFALNLERAAVQNPNFRTTLWTGDHMQLTEMSIDAGESIGLEMHPNIDQFIYIASGQGLVKMGADQAAMTVTERLGEGNAFIIPAGTWHNLTNVGRRPLKLFSIYAPPQHPHGTVHTTKAESDADEMNDH